jgi:hypothetical protein
LTENGFLQRRVAAPGGLIARKQANASKVPTITVPSTWPAAQHSNSGRVPRAFGGPESIAQPGIRSQI